MLPIFGTPEQPAESAKPAPATPPEVSPSAQAAIPPGPTAAIPPAPTAAIPPAPSAAPAAPVKTPTIAAIGHPAPPRHHVATAAEKKKFAALMKRLVPAHREAVHHEGRRVVVHETEPDLPSPGMVVPPPGYYPPGPYSRHLVYAGPYRMWGAFRGPYPYYDYP